MTSFRRGALSLFLALIFITIIFERKVLQTGDDVYEEVPSDQLVQLSRIKFKEVSLAMGIKFSHNLAVYRRNPSVEDRGLALGSVMPSIAVADFDGDGFQDIFLTNPKVGFSNALYRNLNGKKFVDIAAEVGLATHNGDEGLSSVGVWGDFNEDGRLDMLLGRRGCHKLFLKAPSSKGFLDRSELLPEYCSGVNGLNIFDYNGDGHLDILLANYQQPAMGRPPDMVDGFGDKINGQENVIFENNGKNFKLIKPFPNRSYTNSVGLAYIDSDMWVDVFFGNDYSTDELYLNDKGKKFTEITNESIPISKHGFFGMNADFADFNMDGKMDLYVTNVVKPPYYATGNLLWKNLGNGKFKSVGKKKGVSRCGWSWAAKFGDFDLDGQLEIAVVNGRFRGSKLSPEAKGKSFWFNRVNERMTPPFLRNWLVEVSAPKDFADINFSGFERNCFFQKINDSYVDVASVVGFADDSPNRALAIIDFDNDGRIDMVTAAFGGDVRLYHNQTSSSNFWLGLELLDQKHLTYIEGSRVKVVLGDGRTFVKDAFSANGFRGQNDPRLLFGFGDKPTVVENLEVTWPNGSRESFFNVELNKYNQIKRGTGVDLD